jgi:hypothetical protein
MLEVGLTKDLSYLIKGLQVDWLADIRPEGGPSALLKPFWYEAEQSSELVKTVTLRRLRYTPVYLPLANIDLPEYYLVLVAG